MWHVRDVLYAVLYVRVSCFVVRGCGVSRRYIDVCYCDMFSVVNVYLDHLKFYVVCINSRRYVCCSECDVVSNECQIQIQFLTAQSTQIKSVISVPIKDYIHHYPRALFNDIPRVGAYFYDISGSGRTLTTCPGWGAV